MTELVAPAAILLGAAILYQKSNVPARVVQRIRNPDSFPIQYQHFKQKDLLNGGPAPGVPINLQTSTIADASSPQEAMTRVYDEYAAKLEPSDYHQYQLASSVQAGEFYPLREENGRHLQVLMPAYNGELYVNEPYRNNGIYASGTPYTWQ